MDKKWHVLESLLRRGERSQVLKALNEIAREPLRAECRVQLARLYRKSGAPARALQILGPWQEQTSDLRRAEYGAALLNLGATREGLLVLDSLRAAGGSHQDPRVTWIRAATKIREWDWLAAIPLLERLPSSEMYLATCLIHGAQDYNRATDLLEAVLRASPQTPGDPRLVQATSWLLLAQSRSLSGAHKQSVRALAQARAFLPARISKSGTMLSWMIRQWELLLVLRRQKDHSDPAVRAALRELLGPVKQGFRTLGGWEWARSCPLFVAEIQKDRQALERLYWSTPYPAFRARLASQIGTLSESYDFTLGARSSIAIELETGAVGNRQAVLAQLKPGQAKHRLLQALASDLHRPHRLAELHEKTFSASRYRPESSPDRTHKLLRRLRRWLQENDVPLDLKLENGGYQLSGAPGCQLRLGKSTSQDLAPGPALGRWLREAAAAFGSTPFSAAQALERLGGSRRTVARRLSEASRTKLLERSGSGPATVYRAEKRPGHAPADRLAQAPCRGPEKAHLPRL